MKFEIKTEPVCTVLIAVPAYAAIIIITLGTGVQAHDAWFPLSVVVATLVIGISFVTSGKFDGKYQTRGEPSNEAPGRG